jgi:hypothetical protein
MGGKEGREKGRGSIGTRDGQEMMAEWRNVGKKKE